MLIGDRGSRIGVSIRDLNDADLKAGKSGVLIDDVLADGPAAPAGMKNGDIVTSFDGERVRSARQLARLVEETPAGRSVKAEVLRDGHARRAQRDPRGGRTGRGPHAQARDHARRRQAGVQDG